MPLTDLLVLPPDVLVIPVARLSADLRRRIDATDGDFAVTRIRRRTSSKIVNADGAELLELFRTPNRVVDVVRDQGRQRRLDPDRLLDDIFPLVRDCFNAGFLVPAGSPEAGMTQSTLVRGDRIGGYEILRSIQILEDTELYQARNDAGDLVAIKLATRGSSRATRAGLAFEARVLQRLAGQGAPALLASGTHQRFPFLALSWCAGVTTVIAFGKARQSPEGEDRPAMLRLATAVVEAYASLHARGVIHGDVQPNNILVDRFGAVTIIDFGSSRVPGGGHAPRGGVGFFLDPELAARELAHRPVPMATARGDQYSLAALLYSLFTGDHYLDFSLERERMLAQIHQDPPLSFTERGRLPWPEVERILGRALSKDAKRRFPSVKAFAAALSRLSPAPSLHRSAPRPPAESGSLEGLVRQFVHQCEPRGAMFQSALSYAPYGSITFGGAGIALALYRIASLVEDPLALCYADCWLNRTENNFSDRAFYNHDLDITPEVVGRTSPYHTASGVHCTRAMLGQAFGNPRWASRGIEQFVTASRKDCQGLDLTLGRSGTLLGSAMLHECLLPTMADLSQLESLGAGTVESIWQTLDRLGPPGSALPGLASLGIAHGWAGVLYATLRWCQSSGSQVPSRLEERLDHLATLAEATGSGVSWPMLSESGDVLPATPGWCNGSAGFVHLWTMAHSFFQADRYLRLAEQSGWHAWEAVDPAPNLCCGAAGRVYGLLNLYRHTGDADWLLRARALGLPLAEGVLGVQPPVDGMSLYKGIGGVAVMAADLLRPELSGMPFFESEQWPSTTPLNV